MASSAGRTSGSKLVVAVVGGMIGMVGLGTIYLPFMADRDQLRGMDEDGGMNKKAKKEYEQMMRMQQQQQSSSAASTTEGGGGVAAGSMWKNMRKTSQREKK